MKSNKYFMVLDIETSTQLQYDEKLNKELPINTWLSYGVCKLYTVNYEQKLKCRFRDWETLDKFFNMIMFRFKKKECICYVHNLSYEFDFLLKNISKPQNMCCNSQHKVISCKFEKYKTIEFKCSYLLTNKSLRKIGDEIMLEKLESEYRTIYPYDEITHKEWEYCERDCDIVAKYICEMELKEYGLLTNIPLTSTGKVRKDFYELLKKYPVPNYMEEWDTMPPENCYEALNNTFFGAITMSNPRFTKRIINGRIKCFDEKSKYPGVMLAEEFPYTIEKSTNFVIEDLDKNKFWIAKLRIKDIISKYEWGYLSMYNCQKINIGKSDIFNGKILSSNEIEIFFTNVDLETFNLGYRYSTIEVLEFYPLKKYSKLPIAFVELIKKYAQPKFELKQKLKILENEGLKNTEEYRQSELEYGKSKNKLNSIYGMMVQKLVQSEYIIDDLYLWHEIDKPYVQKQNKHIKRNFLYGIFITSYARRDLVKNIVHNCPDTFVYCDTDSIKYIDNGEEFEDINKKIPIELNTLSYLKNFNRFDEEEPYEKFITYGAKKYGYLQKNIFHYTVAGLPKNIKDINSFDKFILNTTYKNCKLAKRYLYNYIAIDFDYATEQEFLYTNDYSIFIQENSKNDDVKSCGGVALYNTDYTLSMTKEDLLYLERNYNIWERKNTRQNILI